MPDASQCAIELLQNHSKKESQAQRRAISVEGVAAAGRRSGRTCRAPPYFHAQPATLISEAQPHRQLQFLGEHRKAGASQDK
eukprot:6445060-Pyramimonas_sp.AAC.1